MIKHITKTLCIAFVLLAFNGIAGTHSAFHFAQGITQKDYLPNTLVIKVKPAYRSQCTTNGIEIPALQQLFSSINVASVVKIFPNHQPPVEQFDQYGRPYVDLSLIYQVKYRAGFEMPKIINSLMNTDVLEYAEPKYIPTTQAYTPNDPSLASQSFLTRIHAFDGWDISKGDTNVVIGIDDTGSDLDHPDLAGNLKHNYNDPVDGVDNDSDGYVDNFNGWDLGENDNDPTVNANSHGSAVSGDADAVTDNGVGVAGPGFYCKFMPIKISDAGGSLTNGYEGIVYGADHGCNIINCSWGGGGGGAFGQNAIDYATINKNTLVVVAAGNNNSTALFYPAAFEHVLSIGATNSNNDGKASFSNYGSYVDVCAPGNGIYSTVYDNAYAINSGTSMASPIAAGCAAIIKSYYPSYNALQVAEKLRITADNIYGVNGNSTYLPLHQLGTGRVNLYNALTQSGPSVRMEPIRIVDNNDNAYIIGDTLRITGDFTNYLDPVTNLSATISAVGLSGSNVTILDNNTSLGSLGTMGMADNNADPFTVLINPGTPQNIKISFKIVITDGTYTDYASFEVIVNVDYINITTNEVYTSNTSKGRICYNANLAQSEGLGFTLGAHGTFSYETGLMIGSGNNVSDVVRNSGTADEDFISVIPIQKHEPGIWSDFDTYGSFNDNGAAVPLNVSVDYRSFSWSLPPNSRYHIFEYTIHNTGNSTLPSLYAGIFSDWDITDSATHNKADEDAAHKMGYVWSTDSNLYAGIKLLTAGAWNHYAIDNVAGGGGALDISTGFTSAKKYTALSTPRATAGGTGTGKDVCDVVSSGPFVLNAGDSVRVAFALIAGESLQEIINSGQAAQNAYNIVTGINEVSSSNVAAITAVYPNPVNDVASFNLRLEKSEQVEITVYDLLGNKIVALANGMQQAGNNHYSFNTKTWSKGMYMLSVKGTEMQLNTRFVVAE